MGFKKGLLSRSPFAVTYQQQVAAATLLTSQSLFVNEPGAAGAGGGEIYEVLSVVGVWDVVGGAAATADITIAASTAAITAGVSVLTGTGGGGVFVLSATARATTRKALVNARTSRLILAGGQLALILAGTLTGLVGLNVTVWLQAMRGIRSR